jgi:hypothetical protein
MCCHNGSHSSKHENDRVAFRKMDITAKCFADRRGSSLSARTVSQLPTTGRVTRPVNTSAFIDTNPTDER